MIVLKEALSPFLEIVFLGHELGHHFFHPGAGLSLLKHTLFSQAKLELEVNASALCAMLPTPILEQLVQEKGYPYSTAIKATSARSTGTSPSAWTGGMCLRA